MLAFAAPDTRRWMLAIGMALLLSPFTPTSAQELLANGMILLPAPRLDGATSVEQALEQRRSLREDSADPLSLDQIAQILWAAQGVTRALEERRASEARPVPRSRAARLGESARRLEAAEKLPTWVLGEDS